MAELHNAIAYGTDLQHALLRAMGGADEAETGTRIGETIVPICDIWSKPEWPFLRAELHAMVGMSVGAVVGEQSACALFNPTGSGYLVTISHANVSAQVAGTVFVSIATEAQISATLGTGIATIPIDTRWYDRRSPGLQAGTIAQARTGSDAGTIGIVGERARVSAVNLMQDLLAPPVVLHPGFGFVAQFQTANNFFEMNLHFYERRLLPGEVD
jgi:hypothetical protein